MSWNVYGLAIPTKSVDYNLDEIAIFLSNDKIINSSINYNREIHNTTIEKYDTGIMILNKKLSSFLFKEERSPFENKLFEYFNNPEYILGFVNTDNCYKGYSYITQKSKRFRINHETKIEDIISYGFPISEEINWLNALKKEVRYEDGWSFEGVYFKENPDKIFAPWEVIQNIQIEL